MQTPFTVSSRYDSSAYTALSEASWQLFMIPRFRTRAYPILLALDVIILYTLIFRRDMYPGKIIFAVIALFVFFIAVIPLIALRTKRGVYKKSVADAKKNGMFDETLTFTFEDDEIVSEIRDQEAYVSYEDVVFMARMDAYILLFFGQGGYILPTSGFKSQQEVEDFEQFLIKKVGLPLVQMKKKYI